VRILGTNFFGHDSAVFLIDTAARDVFAMSTERVTRIKHDWGDVSPVLDAYPLGPVQHAGQGYASLKTTEEAFARLSYDRAYRAVFKPRSVADLALSQWHKMRLLFRAVVTQPLDVARFVALKIKQSLRGSRNYTIDDVGEFMRTTLAERGLSPESITPYDHHLCHAASAYFFAPIPADRRAVVLTLDGFGDDAFSKLFVFQERTWDPIGESKAVRLNVTHPAPWASIGLIYGNFTDALGLVSGSDEGKVEALAAYGEPDRALLHELTSCVHVTGTAFEFDPVRTSRFYDMDRLRLDAARIGERSFAASIQRWLEDIVVAHLNLVHERLDESGLDTLCLAGGVCANVVMTLSILERTPFKCIYVFPGMGDEGVAAGAAVLAALRTGEDVSWLRDKRMPYFGNRVSAEEVAAAVGIHASLRAERLDASWPAAAAEAIAQDKVIGVIQGRMEFGPRALGNRSILANPASPHMRDRLNASIKRRPWYQPFGPSVLESERTRLFEQSFSHKHMAMAFRMREEFRDALRSAVHVDGTARPQFVEERDNPPFHQLLTELQQRTGFGVVINTSFNLHGRTMVRTAKDAVDDFLACDLDELFVEGFRITKRPRD
jgi:carbamoyltransferase